jgi:hypothetical protein
MTQPNQFEKQVQMIVAQTGRSPADVRVELMHQFNLSYDAYAVLNPRDIRSTLPGGGFMGQPG